MRSPLSSDPAGARSVRDGVILVDKPAGVTSHDVVAGVRRSLARGTKVGHAGTLDPFATGLLLVLVGRATRVQRYLMALPKVYEAVARLGWTSTTGDVEGELAPGALPPDPLQLPTGRIWQRPPAYSAVKVGGRRAYELARRGEEVELAPREVEISAFELLARDSERARLRIECSSGTYVRALVAAIGDAYCEELRRTRIGPFAVEDADSERIVELERALTFMPAVALDAEEGRRAGHGRPLARAAAGPVRLQDPDGLVAIAEPTRDGSALKPVVGFRG